MTNTATISMYAGPTAPALSPAGPTNRSLLYWTALLSAHYVQPNPSGTITQPAAASVQPLHLLSLMLSLLVNIRGINALDTQGLGKHMRLLFVSSSTVISSCFDIIHLDVWTSPIPSLLVSPLPKYYRDAFNDPNWQNAMHDEYTTLIKNKTWNLVHRLADTNIVRCMWLFHHKYLAYGKLSRYKARLVANGSTQLEGVDVDETFSPVVKPGTIRTVLSLAASRHWPIHQLDVKNAFLHSDLSKTIYMHQPPGFWDSVHPDYVCLLQRQGTDTSYLLLYVGDIVLTAFSESLVVLSQKKYALEILDRAHMANCNPSRTPIDSESKLGSDGNPVSDLTLYRSLAGSLQYLTFTRSDISYAVQQLFSSSTTDLVVYSDADWAGCPTTRRSTFGYCVFLGNNLLSWSSKRQPTLSHSSAEGEYRGVANVVAETCWLPNLLRELHTPLSSATLVYFAAGQVRVIHVPSRYQFADIFTKGLSSALFEEF
ncbi:ribonuclease H-like domain-containing protein [Tanacetum coccineum]|uniref:Ribonuclease H-like domain-containing protein n=1 Tax=Tanacetum coccineum TaxID=301880 RepID=A0ABQ5GSI4_9ASTR